MNTSDSNKKTLASLASGEKGKVLSVSGTDAISVRLMEMGIVPGEIVRVVKTAPFGDPMEIKIRGYHLALRKNEAQMIEVHDIV